MIRLRIWRYLTISIRSRFCDIPLPGGSIASQGAGCRQPSERRPSCTCSPMEGISTGSLPTRFRKQGLPVQMVASPEEADFVMTSLYQGLGFAHDVGRPLHSS